MFSQPVNQPHAGVPSLASIHHVNRVIVSGWGVRANVILGLVRVCLSGRSLFCGMSW
jgi:hypothetical protein